MGPRLGYLLYWIASWIAVIVIAAGIVVWLYFAQPNKDPLGLVIVGWGIIVAHDRPPHRAATAWRITPSRR